MARPARQRQSPTRAEQRRDELITRLIDLFLAAGFADASIEDLANALRCSKSTLYSVAASKEQIIVTTVRRFFRRAASRVEAQLRREDGEALERIRTYLMAISEELAPASAAFFADLDATESTREIYRENTQIAALRLQEIVLEAVPATSRNHAVFVAAVATQVMEGIHRGEIESATGLADSAAYRSLADLIVSALSTSTTDAAPTSGRRPPE